MPYIIKIRMEMPRIGTRKLYFLLENDIRKLNMKIGRDALFSYLRTKNMLVKPIKSYTKQRILLIGYINIQTFLKQL